MDNMYEQKQMPHNNEAEQSVLGAIILDPQLINRLRKCSFLSPFIEVPTNTSSER